MPDLPTPQNADEAALFSEYWDAVLSYADLCTSGSAAATQLATQAFTHGIREARAAGSEAKGAGRRVHRLPRIPLLLTSVRTQAAAWEAHGQGHRLDPDLRLWLNSASAARYAGPPLHRPLALRGLQDMQEADAALLWLAEVEAVPLPAVARRLGLDPAAAAQELAQVRALFRDRCHRNHLDTPMDAHCRTYARLLDAVTRSAGAETPDDLSRHLARCVECAEAAACLRLHGGGLPAALAGGVIGWGGLAYLERRRRAADAGLVGGHQDLAMGAGLAGGRTARRRIGRTGLLVAAVLVSALALGVSLMPFDDAAGGEAEAAVGGEPENRQPVADPGSAIPVPTASPSTSTSASVSASASVLSADPSDSPSSTATSKPDTEPQGDSSSTAPATHKAPAPKPSAAPSCEVAYQMVGQWPGAFQATVTVTTAKALDTWRVSWTFQDGQRVTQMWDATLSQEGSRVTAAANSYNSSVAAGGSLSFGFLGSWQGTNSSPHDFTLNGGSCGSSG